LAQLIGGAGGLLSADPCIDRDAVNAERAALVTRLQGVRRALALTYEVAFTSKLQDSAP